MLTSAIANELPAKSKATTADPVFQFLNMTFSYAVASMKAPTGRIEAIFWYQRRQLRNTTGAPRGL
jgi:hypothetical protein